MMEKLRISMFLWYVITMNWARLKYFIDDLIASWTMKQRWRWAWKGRICLGFELFQKSHPGETVNAVAIRGGPQCDWELAQLKTGGQIRKSFPKMTLTVFEELGDLKEALRNGTFKNARIPSE